MIQGVPINHFKGALSDRQLVKNLLACNYVTSTMQILIFNKMDILQNSKLFENNSC